MVVMDGTLALIKPDAMHRQDDTVIVLNRKRNKQTSQLEIAEKDVRCLYCNAYKMFFNGDFSENTDDD
jgi:hypothetical protein